MTPSSQQRMVYIMQRLSLGYGLRDIASELGVKEQQIKNFLCRDIYPKLGVDNVVHFVSYGFRHQLIS